jgi:hypothetical protein
VQVQLVFDGDFDGFVGVERFVHATV